jgi:signal transduction histidine kinase
LNLQVNQEQFYVKYALFYTLVVLVILLFPFAVYTNYVLKMADAKTEIMLKKESIEVIVAMEHFAKSNKEYFDFPRLKSSKAGLYDKNSNAIFTLIQDDLLHLRQGYHHIHGKRLYVTQFDTERYFGGTYLAIMAPFDLYTVLFDLFVIFLSIVAVTFLLSFIILKSFAKPFNQINKSLDTFIKDSMHEINTPLSIININIDMFVSKHGKDKYLARIKSASKILSRIYNDMNYLIKENIINASAKERLNFSQFVKKSVDYFDDIAVLKDITLKTDIQEDIFIDFVPTKLQKLIDNNLSNAVKYSNEESAVEISLYEKENCMVLRFKDYGIGMKNPEQIFSRYYREDETQGGFGIGLNLVKKIIEDEGIVVKIDSKLGEGSTFEYTFVK